MTDIPQTPNFLLSLVTSILNYRLGFLFYIYFSLFLIILIVIFYSLALRFIRVFLNIVETGSEGPSSVRSVRNNCKNSGPALRCV